MKAADVIAALHAIHLQPEWAFLVELRCGTGFSKAAEKRIDAWAFNCYPSKNFHRIAYEVKVSRSDFLSELKHPRKKSQAMKLSNEFYFVAPSNIIDKSELPKDCGLIEISAKGKPKIVVPAKFREGTEPTWLFLASIIRRACKNEANELDYTHFSDNVVEDIHKVLLTSSVQKSLSAGERILMDALFNEKKRRKQYAARKKRAEAKARRKGGLR